MCTRLTAKIFIPVPKVEKEKVSSPPRVPRSRAETSATSAERRRTRPVLYCSTVPVKSVCPGSPRCLFTGTHGRTRAHGRHRRTSQRDSHGTPGHLRNSASSVYRRLCLPFSRGARVPCVPCVSRLPPVTLNLFLPPIHTERPTPQTCPKLTLTPRYARPRGR